MVFAIGAGPYSQEPNSIVAQDVAASSIRRKHFSDNFSMTTGLGCRAHFRLRIAPAMAAH
jgi:hypothetical protein